MSLGRPFNVLKVQPLIQEAQKLLAAASLHVHQDAQQTLAPEVMPAIQQMLGMLQQIKQTAVPPASPDVMAQVNALTQTAMAETNRRAQKDQAETYIDSARLAQDKVIETQRLQLDAAENTEDNLVKERMQSAELTQDAIRLQNEQVQTALKAQKELQSNLGE